MPETDADPHRVPHSRSCGLRVALLVAVLVVLVAPRAPARPAPAAGDGTVPAPAGLDRARPADAPIAIHARNAGALMRALMDSDAWRRVVSMPALHERLAHGKGRDALNALHLVAGMLRCAPEEVPARLLGEEARLWITPNPGADPAALYAVLAADADAAERLARATATLAAFSGGGAAHADDEDDGVQSGNGREFHAVAGRAFLLGNRREDVVRARAALDPARAEPQSSGAGAPEDAASPGVFVRADLDALRASGAAQPVPETFDNALGALLAQGLVGALGASHVVEAALRPATRGFAFDVALDATPGSTPERLRWFFAEAGPPVLRTPPPGTIARVDLSRDVREFYARRFELLDERLQGGLLEFENVMGIFFSGRSFGDEVLPAIGRPATLVVAPQSYADLPRPPAARVPGFALVAPLDVTAGAIRRPDLLVAFQTALGLVNAQRGQMGLDPMIQSAERRAGADIVAARFLLDDEAGDAPPPLRFNAEPALAVGADYLIFGSSLEHVRALVDAMAAAHADQGPAADTRNSALHVDAPALARILDANRAALIAKRMIEEGEDRATAEAFWDAALRILGTLDHVDLSLDASADSGAGVRARLEVTTRESL